VLRICIGFQYGSGSSFLLNANPDSDPGSQNNTDPCDPDPGQTLRSRNVGFDMKSTLYAGCNKTFLRTRRSKKAMLKAVLRIRIRDPGLGAFLTPGSGIRDGRKSASGSGIRDEQPGSYFFEHRNHFFLFCGYNT
jgi:hypothetical protein